MLWYFHIHRFAVNAAPHKLHLYKCCEFELLILYVTYMLYLKMPHAPNIIPSLWWEWFINLLSIKKKHFKREVSMRFYKIKGLTFESKVVCFNIFLDCCIIHLIVCWIMRYMLCESNANYWPCHLKSKANFPQFYSILFYSILFKEKQW